MSLGFYIKKLRTEQTCIKFNNVNKGHNLVLVLRLLIWEELVHSAITPSDLDFEQLDQRQQ